MKKREQGVLTVEASIVLVLMLLFILFIFSFGRVYRAQNLVSHASLQAADAVALESYMRETALQADAAEVVYLANHMTGGNAISAESLQSLRSANVPKIVRQKFITAIANNEAAADEKLRAMGIKDGLSGIDFSHCQMDLVNDDVIVAITYTIKMQFPVFGFDEVTVTKAAKAKTFGEILFEVTTKPNNPGWGSTGGDDKVTHGSNVVITATPNYGYIFKGWDDNGDGIVDNTDPNRTVTVTDQQKHVAIFEKNKFGINLSTKVNYDTAYANTRHLNPGTVSGAGNFEYLATATISAAANEHYEFVGWDDNGDNRIDNRNASRTISVDKTYNIKAIFKPRMYTVTTTSNNDSYGVAQAVQGSKRGSSIQVEYGSKVQLTASSKDSVRYSFNNWSHNSTQTSTTVTVYEDCSYEANFIQNTYKVTFMVEGKAFGEEHVLAGGSSINGSSAYTNSKMPGNPDVNGRVFSKWVCGGNTFTGTTIVNGNTTVEAAWKCVVRLDGKEGKFDGKSSDSYEVDYGGSSKALPSPTKTGYIFAGWKLSGKTYNSGDKVNNVTQSITLEAQWKECTKHVWGHCGHKHPYYGTIYPSNIHKHKHDTTWMACTRCINCKALGKSLYLCGKCWDLWPGDDSGFGPYAGENPCGPKEFGH